MNTENNNNLYPFDAEFINVELNARPDAENPVIVTHKMRRPTFDELNDREQRVKYEMVSVSTKTDEVRTDDQAANIQLWGKIIAGVKGYDGGEDWRELTDEEKARFYPGHKVAAIRGMYAGSCQIEGDCDYVPIGPTSWTVRQNFGRDEDSPDYVVRHTLRQPTEAERQKFNPSTTSFVRGAKKARVQITTRLRPYVELYDALIERVEGATVGDAEFSPANRAEFIAAIDPMWKRHVIDRLMSALEAQLSD